MKTINVSLLGNPVVIANGETVKFPYKKSEGLFYYICLNKEILRSQAISIFWPDIDDQNAKKRLRDALYKIKKSVSPDIFVDDNKQKIKLNEKILDIDTDYLDDLTPAKILELADKQSSIEFLGAFIIKNSAEFEEWMYQNRESINRIYAKKLGKYLDDNTDSSDIVSVIKSIINLFSIFDPYNETVYRKIMQILADKKEYNEAIKVYYDLVKLLKLDLSIEPELDTNKLFEKISFLKNSNKKIVASFFYGRKSEKEQILKELYKFDFNEPCKSIAIKGEAGVGKTALIKEIVSSINKEKYLILKTNCYAAESEFCYKPLNTIISQLGKYIDEHNIEIDYNTKAIICSAFPNFNSNRDIDLLNNANAMNFTNVTDSITKVIKIIGRTKKIILFTDDLQWMDNMSFSLISNILYADNNKNILFLSAFRNDYESQVRQRILPLITKDILFDIPIERFNFDEVSDIISSQVKSEKNISINKIFSETEGNALFLSEVIKLINDNIYTNKLSYKTSNIIESRILDLSASQKKIIDALSIFFHKTSFDMIKFLVEVDSISLYSDIELLIEKHLVVEIVEGAKTYYGFSHQKIREYIYDKQSVGKVTLLHKIISEKYIDLYNINQNPNLLSDLIYHTEKSNQDILTAKYKLEFAKEFYTAYHESFPTISHNFCYNNSDDASISIEFLEKLCVDFENNYKQTEDVDALKIELNFILARLYISQADYSNGLEKLNYSINLAKQYNNIYYLIEDYKQMIFYFIQTGYPKGMKEYIDKSLTLIDIETINSDSATFERLLGLYYIKVEKYDIATSHLMKSIKIINALSNNSKDFRMAIAASYNYLGQLNKIKHKYSIAFKYFSKAIEISSNAYSSNGLGIFYSNAGQSLYRMNKIEESLKYFETAIYHFEQSNTIWGRDVAECFIASTYRKMNKETSASKHIETAKALGAKLKNPSTIKLLNKYDNNTF